MKFLIALCVLALASLIYVRFSPLAPEKWHIDPETAAAPGPGGAIMRRSSAKPPEQALADFAAIAEQAPRTRHLAGSVADRHISYVARSRLFGFPDIVTAKAVANGDGSQLILLSRLRFGVSDLGVNKRRLQDWLGRLDAIDQ